MIPHFRPSFGAWIEEGGARFRVWAPGRTHVELILEDRAGEARAIEKAEDGTFSGFVPGLPVGELYRYRLDGEGPFPDPASRFQPHGVHGPSEIVDPGRFPWSDDEWRGVGLEELIIYELHVGTFSSAGTFAGVRERLPYLSDLGVTAIELMPVAAFAGRWNWGYDGVALFAPAACYGRPDDLRELVDSAHRLGLAVLLDVVYNHLGPDGAYQGTFGPGYFTEQHRTPWGAAVNLDGPLAAMVREFLVENALAWLREYHLDGLRLDATDALVDDSPRHFVAELTSRVREGVRDRPRLIVAEDCRNLAHMVRPEAEGGWGLDAVWADDFHHQVRRALAGDSDGYYRDFTGTTADLATTIRQGWFFTGQHSAYLGAPRGTDPAGLPPRRFVIFLQNHDQVGNRALGERLHHQIDLAAYRAATALLLCAPETPLLFAGQEWAASAPFLYFTDHRPALGRLVSEGRRREFKGFAAFADPTARERIPDPQDPGAFARSRLEWDEIGHEPHASTLRLYRALLALRRDEPLLGAANWDGFEVEAQGDAALVLRRSGSKGRTLGVLLQLRGPGLVRLAAGGGIPGPFRWSLLFCSEDEAFCADPVLPDIDLSGTEPVVGFSRPGAVILKRT